MYYYNIVPTLLPSSLHQKRGTAVKGEMTDSEVFTSRGFLPSWTGRPPSASERPPHLAIAQLLPPKAPRAKAARFNNETRGSSVRVPDRQQYAPDGANDRVCGEL